MTASLKDLLAQREALEKAIADARQAEIAHAVQKVRELVAQHGLTAQDVFPGRGARAAGKGAEAPGCREALLPHGRPDL